VNPTFPSEISGEFHLNKKKIVVADQLQMRSCLRKSHIQAQKGCMLMESDNGINDIKSTARTKSYAPSYIFDWKIEYCICCSL
jgi:hypothetical protein